MRELYIWHRLQWPETDQLWIRSDQMHLKIPSEAEAAQFRKFYSDFDIMKRGWPNAGILHLAQISITRGVSVLDSFSPNESENQINTRMGPDQFSRNRRRSSYDASGPATSRQEVFVSEVNRMQITGYGKQDLNRFWPAWWP